MITENAYLYREECELVVVGDADVLNSKWMEVKLEEGSSPTSSSVEDELCHACDLAVAAFDGESVILCGGSPRFDGTAQGMKPKKMPSGWKGSNRRSDAHLLLGLAMTCQDLKHIIVQSIQIRLQDTAMPREGKFGAPHRRIASMYITFHVPQISADSWKGKNRRFISTSSKMLPPSTQLLLSLIRSDWDYLDASISQARSNYSIRRPKHGRRRKQTLFPTKLNLNEVYPRIGSAAFSLDTEIVERTNASPISAKVTLDSLPIDVLRHRIAVFLRARSLDSWRCTCKFIHRSLRSAVPGMKLQLYNHQIKSLSWMRYRETRPISESDLLSTASRRINCRDGDAHRAASGGASAVLTLRGGSAESIHISQFDGDELIIERDNSLPRMVARGGLLCDDPGLGKTITVLSLILQTFGLSTSSNDNDTTREINDSNAHEEEEKSNDQRIFEEYWNESIVPRDRVSFLLSFLGDFQRRNREIIVFFMLPVNPIEDGCPNYLEVIDDPICVSEIRKKIGECEYDTFGAFEQDMERMFANAILYNPPASEVHTAALELKTRFREKTSLIKSKTIATAKKSFSRTAAKPNSKVAALVEKSNRNKLKNSLAQSSATLLVVPAVLLEHWEEQLQLHVDVGYCTSKIPIVFSYTGSKKCRDRMEEVLVQCDTEKTHYPLLFIDKTGSRKLPPAHFLSRFSIVLTTVQRFTNEWKNGSFEDELKKKRSREQLQQENSEEACTLLKIFWLRMIVDEGHSMAKGTENSAISFASWINAERRWAMTGTPTRQTLAQTGLSSIYHLLHYLRHSFFSRRYGGDFVWNNLVTKGWNRGYLSSFFRIQALLSLLMVRHTKLDIEELPPPQYHTTVLPMSSAEVTTYNTLVCAVQSNLLITSMEGKTSGAQDSLLHKSQARHAKKALENVRLVCAGGTQVLPTLSQKNWNEFIRDFELCDPPQNRLESVKKYLSRAVTGGLSVCDSCGMVLSTLLVFPCGHLVCTECVDCDTRECVVCSEPFDVDLFQRLQPGMVYEWLHNVEEELKRKKSKGNRSSTPSASEHGPPVILEGGAGIIAPLDPNRRRRRTRRPGDGHTCVYSPKSTSGECILCWRQHDTCNFMVPSRQCSHCFQRAEDCPESETKSHHIVTRLLELYEEQKNRGHLVLSPVSVEAQPVTKRLLKVIVFSQFRKVLNMAGDRLLRRFGSGCIAEYWGSFRKKELQRFIHDDSCFCMLLGKDGSEGLDLSFVTHIFFMEEVWDKSLQQQAIARAWRMGAKGSVVVETLVAQTSVEETMARLEKRCEEPDLTTDPNSGLDDTAEMKMKLKSSEYQRAKLHFLLKGLRLIANRLTSAYGVNKPPAALKSQPMGQTSEPVLSELGPKKRPVVEHDLILNRAISGQFPKKQRTRRRVRFRD